MSSSFIYVHYETLPDYALTGKISVDDASDTVERIHEKIAQLLKDRKVALSSTFKLRLTDNAGRTIGPLKELFRQAIVVDDPSNNDYFVEICSSVSLPTKASSSSSASTSASGGGANVTKSPSTTNSTSVSTPSPTVSSSSSSSSSLPPSSDLSDLSNAQKKLEDLMKSRMFKKARILSEEISKVASTQKNNGELMSIILYVQSRIHYENERFDRALELAEKSVQLTRRNVSNKASAISLAVLFLHCAKCHFKEGNFEECDSLINDFFSAMGGIASALKGAHNEMACEGLAVKAESVFAQGKAGIAANIVNEVLAGDKGGAGGDSKPGDVPLLQAYAYFAYQYDKIPDALRALLRAVVIDQNNKKTVKLLADVLKTNNIVDEIAQQIPMKAPQAPAYAFLSTIAKDHGAISTSNDLLVAAWRMVPFNCNYVLNLVHNFELTFEFDRALEIAVQFMKENANKTVGTFTAASGDRFTLGDFAIACERFLGASGFDESNSDLFLEWTRGSTFGAEISSSEGEEDSSGSDQDHVVCHNTSEIRLERDSESGKVTFVRTIEIDDGFSGETETLSNDSLDVLALLMTVVKIFYLQGKLNALPQCFLLAEKARRRSSAPLHTTSIRNENAYYMCIAQIMTERVKLIASTSLDLDCQAAVHMVYQSPFAKAYHLKDAIKKNQTIYVIGDSHVLPLSWASFKDKDDNDIVMIPKLVTGIKHYHCRAKSEFYTKTGLLNAVKGTPDKAKVMFVMGEIDCREGILRAVEKDLYPSLEASITTTVSMFVDNILTKVTVVGRKNFSKIYIHPVIPVLKETKHLVKPYNTTYRSKIIAASSSSSKNLAWLDCLSAFTSIEDEFPRLLKDYELDETHVHPKYIEHIKDAINKLP